VDYGLKEAIETSSTFVGLRIDVDTYRGTKIGVPALLKLLDLLDIKATFYFSVGPDNMGRHVWRLLRPKFLIKMLRSRAASLYGWDILLKGTFWPGPLIAKNLKQPIIDTKNSGHEIGLHAWDHQQWQSSILNMEQGRIERHIAKGMDELADIIGEVPQTSAAPGWRCNDTVLQAKNSFPFLYNSDCRGTNIFHPIVAGKVLQQAQIPVTLPTYDELIGVSGISEANYNDYLLKLIRPKELNVLTIHAEVEGIVCFDLFHDFLLKGIEQGIKFVPLIELYHSKSDFIETNICQQELPGREGLVAVQT